MRKKCALYMGKYGSNYHGQGQVDQGKDKETFVLVATLSKLSNKFCRFSSNL